MQPVSNISDSFGSTAAKIALWFVAAAVIAGILGLTGSDDGEASVGSSDLFGEQADGDSATAVAPDLDARGPEAKNAKAFLQSYYDAILETNSRATALETMLTPSFRQSANRAVVDEFWDAEESSSVSEVVPLPMTRYKATVTHLPEGSHAVPQLMEFELACDVSVSSGTACPLEELRIADAIHLSKPLREG